MPITHTGRQRGNKMDMTILGMERLAGFRALFAPLDDDE